MFLEINNISIDSILSVVPKEKFEYSNNSNKENKISRVARVIGVKSSFKANSKVTTTDLFYDAAKKIIDKNKLNKNKIDILICVTQTPDYLMPSCSNIIHQKLSLKQECLAYDINLGCSGYVYGLWNIMSLMEKSKMKKGILLVGDTISKTIDNKDKSNQLLFGDGVSATIIGIKKKSKSFFKLGSGNYGYDKLMIKDSGFRNMKFNKANFYMDGKEVFNFVIKNVPNLIKELIKTSRFKAQKINSYIFHQANKMMIEKIFDLLNISKKKRLYSIEKYGNTSSASIPITLSFKLYNKKINSYSVLAGFGAGFSFAACIIDLRKTRIFKIYNYAR